MVFISSESRKPSGRIGLEISRRDRLTSDHLDPRERRSLIPLMFMLRLRFTGVGSRAGSEGRGRRGRTRIAKDDASNAGCEGERHTIDRA